MDLNELALLTLSTGLYAGLGTTLTLVTVPAIMATSDPLPGWRTVYNNASKIALSCIFVSTAAAGACYLKTEDWRYLLISGLSFTSYPYTMLLMKGYIDQLFAINDSKGTENDGKIRKLISKWNNLQYGRTLLGVGAFFVNIVVLHKRL